MCVCVSYHYGGELQEGEAPIELRLFVLDEANVGGRQRGEGGQRRQDGLQRGVRPQVPQDQSWERTGENVSSRDGTEREGGDVQRPSHAETHCRWPPLPAEGWPRR